MRVSLRLDPWVHPSAMRCTAQMSWAFSARLSGRAAVGSFIYTAASREPMRYEVYYFPGWEVRADGKHLEVEPSPRTGLIQFDALPGTHEYRIALGYSSARLGGIALSWTGIALLIGLMAKKRSWDDERFNLAARR